MSALLQFASEHRWLLNQKGPGRDPDKYAERSQGRFCGEALPSPDLPGPHRFISLAGWATRLLLIHAPVRFGVLVGDLPAHDWHHVVGLLRHDPHDWGDAIFERQRAIDEGDVYRLAEREKWGIVAALDWVFDGLARAEV